MMKEIHFYKDFMIEHNPNWYFSHNTTIKAIDANNPCIYTTAITASIKCYYIKNRTKTRSTVYFNIFGEYFSIDNAKCVIFPKGKTTWEGFHLPFKDGDVIANNEYIAIFHKLNKIPNGAYNDVVYYHCWCRKKSDGSKFKIDFGIGYESDFRFATEEEKQKLFKAIEDKGYKWNSETKILEKLVKPRFKVGNEIVKRNSISCSWIVDSVTSEYYGLKLFQNSKNIGVLPISEQDEWELFPKKFDITTLKPFDKVLVRDNKNQQWAVNIFGHYLNTSSYPFCCSGNSNHVGFKQCIPYENNKHLLGTTNDCDEFYKNW